MAVVLVGGVAECAHVFSAHDDSAEAFSQRQNEPTVILEARARGLGAHIEGPEQVAPLVPAPRLSESARGWRRRPRGGG